MKKIYLSAAALIACTFLNAQTPFQWTSTSYKGAFPVTDGTTGPSSNDWTSGWANWDPESTVYGAPTSTLTGNVTTNTTLSGIVYLDGFVHVINNSVLTIQPGTIIRGKQTDVSVTPGVLVISRGSKIHAVGTQAQPIIFTSIKAENTTRGAGDWGGVVLCGNARVNLHTLSTPSTGFNEMKVEGFVTDEPNGYRHFGGNNDADNSGIMSYCRIEFAGVSLNPSILNSEINGLTLGGVGSGTQLDHIQVSFSGDDSFEWFGGTVDNKYIIAFRGKDDDFDTDNGFSGRTQFGLAVRDPYIADDSDPSYESNGFECDNNGVSPYLGLPLTKAVFSNCTMVGPYGDGTAYGDIAGVNTHHKSGAHLRRNMAQNIFNTLFIGHTRGLRYQQAGTLDNINSPSTADSSCFYQNNIITDVAATAGTLTVNQQTFVNDAGVFDQPWYHTFASANNDDTLTTAAQINFVNGFTALGNVPDYRLKAISTVATGALFTNPKFVGGFVGVNELTNIVENSFVLYPNPASQNTTISFNIVEKNNVIVSVYDVLGNLISTMTQSSEFEKGSNTVSLNTSSLASGIYYVSLTVNGAKETKKLVINH
jgi:hypothetical protein